MYNLFLLSIVWDPPIYTNETIINLNSVLHTEAYEHLSLSLASYLNYFYIIAFLIFSENSFFKYK